MSDPLDDLAKAARNRGFKLIRSRIRTPTKRLYGKVALTDATGKPVFGFDPKGRASAKPEAAARFLTDQSNAEWTASLKRRRKT